jgi:hypothetical protein
VGHGHQTSRRLARRVDPAAIGLVDTIAAVPVTITGAAPIASQAETA